jgi:hypothetical protein
MPVAKTLEPTVEIGQELYDELRDLASMVRHMKGSVFRDYENRKQSVLVQAIEVAERFEDEML